MAVSLLFFKKTLYLNFWNYNILARVGVLAQGSLRHISYFEQNTCLGDANSEKGQLTASSYDTVTNT
jgi:hypothetical protein